MPIASRCRANGSGRSSGDLIRRKVSTKIRARIFTTFFVVRRERLFHIATNQREPAMQTSLLQFNASVRRRSPSACLRHGYLGTQAANCQVLQLCPPNLDRLLSAKAGALDLAVCNDLRDATQMVMGHPTEQTLTDAFVATDTVFKLIEQVARRSRSLVDVGLQVRIHVMLSGIRAGLAELELGLEAIQLLPASAPDYPEEE